jgi:peroxiredoxin
MKFIKFFMFLTFLGVISDSNYTFGFQAGGLGVGETIPNPEITLLQKNGTPDMETKTRLNEINQNRVLLIAFMPSLSENYSDIMTSAFDIYFAQGLSFRSFANYFYTNPEMDVIIVTPNDVSSVQKYLDAKQFNFSMVSDKDMYISNLFGINERDWGTNNGSYVYIVDKNNKVVFADYDYKGQGEKLKAVQNELFTLFDIKENIDKTSEYSPLIAGENERDFYFNYIKLDNENISTVVEKESRLSDYIRKKNVLIAFYPAAYSYSCSAEIKAFDHWAEDRMLEKIKNSQLNNDDLEILMVSISNPYILSKWKNELNLDNLKLVSDFDGEISQKYSSYNTFGYNKRTVFLINIEGKVAYINWDYKVDENDFELLQESVTALK